MEIDQNNLRTEIAIGCRAFHELFLNYLFHFCQMGTGASASPLNTPVHG